MPTTTVRIPEDMRDALKIIASIEKRKIKDILSELIEGYMERHKETLEILSHPEWLEEIHKGLKALEKGEVVRWRKRSPGK
jgi:predicted transcriptional regulator